MFTDQMYVNGVIGIAWGFIVLCACAISCSTQSLNEVLFQPMSFSLISIYPNYFLKLCNCKEQYFRNFKYRSLVANKNYDLLPCERQAFLNGKEGTSC
jgi:hypothetical protein